MKYIPLALVALAAIGCGHNEFDVSPAQARRHADAHRPATMPPEAVKTDFKKGDRLPDGTIADHDGTIMSDGR